MGNLNNLYISQSFQSLAHLGTNTSLVPGTMTQLQDGIGQSLNISFDGTNISSSGNIYAANLTGSGGSTNTGSLMVTGSVAANVLTFTKGDGSQFSLTVASSTGTISSSAQITALGFVSSSVTASSLITASFDNGTRNLTFTKGDSTTFAVNIPDVSGSAGNFVTTSSFNAYTQSNDQRVSSLETATASLFTSASLAIITASVNDDDITFTKGDGSTFTIQVATGSFALSSSFAETASIARNLVITARNGNPSTLPIGTVVHITSAVGDNPIFNTASYDTELLSANTLGILRQSATTGTDVEVVVQGKVISVNTDPALGYAAGDVIYLSSSGQFTKVQPQAPQQIVVLGQVLRAQQNNGSIYVSINNGWELNELHNVQINNPLTGDLIQYESSSYGLWKNKSIVGAGITSTSSFNSYTSSNDQKVNSLIAATGSYATTGSNTFTGTNQFTQLLNVNNGLGINGQTTFGDGQILDTITVENISGSLVFNKTAVATKVDLQNLSLLVSGSITASSNISSSGNIFAANLSTFATTGSNTFVGNQIINGNLTASLQQGYVWVGDAGGTTTTVATSSFGGGGAGFPFTGSAQITGSLGVTGSFSGFVNNLAISSQTASLDFNSGNFFTLQLVSGSITHLTATNIRAGQTINLLVKTASGSAAASGSLSFSPTFKFAGGFDYTPTAITASQDLVSFVTFDTTQIFAAQVKNLS